MDEGAISSFGNAIGTALSQIVKFAATIKGVTTILESLSSSLSAVWKIFKSMADIGMGVVGALTAFVANLFNVGGGMALAFNSGKLLTQGFKGLLTGVADLSQALLKGVGGLFMLGGAAAGGGMETFGKVMEYLTTVIGQVATPIFVALTAIVATVADSLKNVMGDAAKTVAEWLANNLVAAIKLTIDIATKLWNAIDWVVTKLMNFGSYIMIAANALQAGFMAVVAGLSGAIGYLVGLIPGLGSTGKAITEFGQELGVSAQAKLNENTAIADGIDARNAEGEARRAANEKAASEFGDKFANGVVNNIKAVRTDMSQSMAMKSNVGFSGIADIQKTIQMQAFKSDFESRTLAEQQKIAQNTDRMVQLLDRRAAASAIGP